MSYAIVKSLHIIFMVSWFAGLFYIVRLFIYHTEAQLKPHEERKILSEQFIIMEKKLWWIITTPAMILTVVFGLTMLLYPGHGYLIHQPWMHVKLGFVVMLLVYHFVCQKILFNLKNNRFKWSSKGLRIWNELATLALVAIVFLAITKGSMNWWKATLGFFLVAISLMLLIKLYKKISKR